MKEESRHRKQENRAFCNASMFSFSFLLKFSRYLILPETIFKIISHKS